MTVFVSSPVRFFMSRMSSRRLCRSTSDDSVPMRCCHSLLVPVINEYRSASPDSIYGWRQTTPQPYSSQCVCATSFRGGTRCCLRYVAMPSISLSSQFVFRSLLSHRAATSFLFVLLRSTLFRAISFHSRDQYGAFLSDILHAREKENKAVHDEVHGVFVVVNVEEESSTAAGLANLDRRLCEQVRTEWLLCCWRGICFVQDALDAWCWVCCSLLSLG